MKSDDIKLKYDSMEELMADMNNLIAMGFAEELVDPKTGKPGYRITPPGIKMFQYYQQLQSGKLN
ncbi:MAG TPA: hypothetical protein DIC42_03810 [Holosporales bacterium]|nr:hypothetical protein [Holosporales bacterium]